MPDRIVLRSLSFTGPNKTSAALTFGDKLTLIWGASNTGKSFTLKALDFMFGGSKALPDINEREGYEGAKATPKADRPVLAVAGSITHEFSQIVSGVLEQWGFPGEHHVSFDDETYDLKIDGKARVANGKGVRAVTHAAFKVALLLFCREKGLPHPGFLVLDTPLLTYRDPLKTPKFGELEDDERALAATSLKDRFFDHLASLEIDAQFIILENVDPPAGLETRAHLEVFSGGDGRRGLFPT